MDIKKNEKKSILSKKKENKKSSTVSLEVQIRKAGMRNPSCRGSFVLKEAQKCCLSQNPPGLKLQSIPWNGIQALEFPIPVLTPQVLQVLDDGRGLQNWGISKWNSVFSNAAWVNYPLLLFPTLPVKKLHLLWYTHKILVWNEGIIQYSTKVWTFRMRNVCSLRCPWDSDSLQILFMGFLFYFVVAEGTLLKRIPVKTQNPCQKCIRFSS